MKEYDAVVIGSGSGLDVANAAAGRGLSVALIEKGPMGGTCLNRGCIPSKMLIHRADLAEKIKNSEKFGIGSEVESIGFSSIIKEVNSHVSEEARHIEKGIRGFDGIDLYKDQARFIDDRTLKVAGKKIRGDKVIVAAGARPFVPPIEGIEDLDYMTSKEALELTEQPEHLVIVGGGYIAAELGHFYGALGTDVTVIASKDRMIYREDMDIREKFTELFSEKYDVRTGFRAEKVREENGGVHVIAESKDGEITEASGDKLLMATGRRPNTDLLDVQKSGMETDEKGFIKVDGYLKTKAENVWAFGDIIDSPMFKHTANMEAEYVFFNAFTDDGGRADYTAMPHAIFSSPQVAGVGMTEQELGEEGTEYLKGIYEYKNTGMGSALKEQDGFVKVLLRPDGEILGCHIIGPHASVLIHEVVVVMKSGGNARNITNSVHVHPALSEVVQRAFDNVVG